MGERGVTFPAVEDRGAVVQAALRLIAKRVPSLGKSAMRAVRSGDPAVRARALRRLGPDALALEGLMTGDERETLILAIEIAGPEGEIKILRVKMTASELDEIKKRAEAERLDVSAYVRRRLGLR